MRMPTRTALSRTTRRVLTAGALAAFLGGALFTGSASASTVLAQGCTGSVVGTIGDQIAVQGKDIADLVKAGAKEQEVLLHLNAVDPDKVAQAVTAKGAIAVGQVPNAAHLPLAGTDIATAVTTALRGADGLGYSWDTAQQQKTLDAIGNTLANGCGITAYASNFSTVTTLPGLGTGGTASVPGTALPGAGSYGTGTATAPPRDYGNVPAAVPGVGIAVSPGAKYPTSAPVAGLPTPELLGGASGQTDVRNTGNADSLAAEPSSTTVQLPMLLAVVALAAVSAALVRTWVLRKLS